MKHFFLLLLFTLSSSVIRCQIADTAFFNEDDTPANPRSFHYYSVYKQLDDRVKVDAYNEKNILIYSGFIKSRNNEENIGPNYYYDDKNRIKHIQVYEPGKYPEVLSQFAEQFKYIEPLPDTLSLNVFFKKNGKIQNIGYMSKSCQKTGCWIFYVIGSKYPTFLCEYSNDQFNGRYIDFNKDGIPFVKGNYKYGKKHGAWEYLRKGVVISTDNYVEGKRVKEIH